VRRDSLKNVSTHDAEAQARDKELARLYPDAQRRHVRATLPARVVLRAVERREGDQELPLVGKTFLTAVITKTGVDFYAGSDPVEHAGFISAGDIVAIETGNEVRSLPPLVQQVIRVKVADVGTEPLDVDLESFEFDGSDLRPTTDVEAEAAGWAASLR
jgi:hypothetical protein